MPARARALDMELGQVINLGLMKHPTNWVIVALMIVIAAIPVHMAISYHQANLQGND